MTTRNTNITKYQHEILEGLIISDGNIHRQNLNQLTTPIFSIKNINLEWMDFLFKELPFEMSRNYTLPSKETIICGKISNRQAQCCIQTKSDNALISYWKRWYNGKDKFIPKDFKLTPTIGRFWFYGDGSSSIYKTGKLSSRVTIRLCTNSFTFDDCERFCEMWKCVGVPFHVGIHKRQPVLTINKANYINKFLSYIGNAEIKSFEYKWKIPNPSNRMKE